MVVGDLGTGGIHSIDLQIIGDQMIAKNVAFVLNCNLKAVTVTVLSNGQIQTAWKYDAFTSSFQRFASEDWARAFQGSIFLPWSLSEI